MVWSQEALLTTMVKQQIQTQALQVVFLEQQQQQNNAMMALLEKLVNK